MEADLREGAAAMLGIGDMLGRTAGGTVILTSHELAELSLCSVMYALKDGTLS